MDRLRRFANRGRNGHSPEGAEAAEKEPQPTKEGGHGDHWGCIFRGVEQDELIGIVQEVLDRAEQPERFAAKGGGAAYRSPGGPVRVCILVVEDSLVSAYPEAEGGTLWPVVVREIVPWANGYEGQITGECHGAAVSFFDTHFYANSDKYRVGEQYNFRMSAFAYSVGRAPDNEVEVEKGVKVSLRGARAYMPANLTSAQGIDIDEFWFHSPLEAPSHMVEFVGKELQVLLVTMALPEEFDMSAPMYAAEHVLDPASTGLLPEEDLEGYLWLQGYLEA